MYKLKNVNCSYPNSVRSVLEISELDINANEIVFFVGPSGVGKSTILETLGLMNDTVENTEDSIFELKINKLKLDMRDIWKEKESTLSQIRNDFFSFIFQENNLFQSLSGMQNAISSSLIQGTSSQLAFEKANTVREDILSDINLDNSTNDFNINGISGGQRQRLSFIRAVITSYNILFADEPTGNLDWLNAEILMNFLVKEMKKNREEMQKDSLAVIVSHDIDLALMFADKIVYIEKKSEIIQDKKYYYGKIDNSTIFSKTDKEHKDWKNEDSKFTSEELKNFIKERFRVAQDM